MRKSVFAALIIMSFILSACGGGGGGGNTTGGGGNPADGAKAFMDAIYAGKGDANTVFCSAIPAASKDAFNQGAAAIKAAGTIDTAGLKYETKNQSGDAADVTVSGNLKANNVDVPFTALTLKMKQEGGAWKMCGAGA
jgi:hypothetical protein